MKKFRGLGAALKRVDFNVSLMQDFLHQMKDLLDEDVFQKELGRFHPKSVLRVVNTTPPPEPDLTMNGRRKLLIEWDSKEKNYLRCSEIDPPKRLICILLNKKDGFHALSYWDRIIPGGTVIKYDLEGTIKTMEHRYYMWSTEHKRKRQLYG